MRILVAEDQLIHARLAGAILGDLGLEMVHVSDGLAAWETLSAPNPPPLALIDWMMPGLSGIELCRRVRENARLAGTYLILLTARDTTDDVVEGLGAGANDFVAKPFEPRELAARVQVGVRVVELERALAARLVELEEALAERAAAEEALRSAREREVAVADRIQQALLVGRPPLHPELEIAALSLPSQRVDGDFYDFFSTGPRRLDVLVGDVMGKGIPAALVAAATKGQFLRALAFEERSESGLPSPAAVLDAVSRAAGSHFVELESFATLAYARFDLAADEICLVDAGHPPTLLVRRDREVVESVVGVDPPLGIWSEQVFTEVRVPYCEGDLAVFYSDGLTEAMSPGGEMFGVLRLQRLLAGSAGDSARDLVARIHAAVATHAGARGLSDDLTCVVIRRSAKRSAGSGSCCTSVIDLAASLDELPRARAVVSEACAKGPARLDDEQSRALVLAVDEAFVNVVRHAYAGIENGRVRLEVAASCEAVEVRLVHRGAGFDPAAVPEPAFDGSRDGGFGVFLIAASVDEVRYEEAADGEKLVRMRKRGRGPRCPEVRTNAD